MPRSSRRRAREEYEDGNDKENETNDRKISDTDEQFGVDDGEGKEANDGEDDDSNARKPSQRRNVALMASSGQTDQERRDLRQALRGLQRKITVTELGDDMEKPESGAFEQVRHENNQLWDKVRYTREAVLEGENLDMISTRASRQVDRLVQVPRYDAVRLSQKLRAKCMLRTPLGDSFFDWKTLGVESGSCFNALPSRVHFFKGPLDVVFVPKERKKRELRKPVEEEDAEEESPEEVKQRKIDQEKNADKLSAVEQHMTVIHKTLNKRCNDQYRRNIAELEEEMENADEEEKRRAMKRVKKHGSDICAVQYLFNPRSFTQTVENIFHFSFLVKKGSGGISLRTEEEAEKYGGMGPGPVVKSVQQSSNTPEPRQAIVALNMQDWRDLCAAFQVERGDIPHRTGSKHAAQPKSESP